MVRLEAIDITGLRELVTDAWHMRAPAELKVDHPLLRDSRQRPVQSEAVSRSE